MFQTGSDAVMLSPDVALIDYSVHVSNTDLQLERHLILTEPRVSEGRDGSNSSTFLSENQLLYACPPNHTHTKTLPAYTHELCSQKLYSLKMRWHFSMYENHFHLQRTGSNHIENCSMKVKGCNHYKRRMPNVCSWLWHMFLQFHMDISKVHKLLSLII